MAESMTVDEVRESLILCFEDEADWRDRKTLEYPADGRNINASNEHKALRDSVSQIPDQVLASFIATRDRVEPGRVNEIESEAFRAIGFRSSYSSATEFLEALMDELARERIWDGL